MDLNIVSIIYIMFGFIVGIVLIKPCLALLYKLKIGQKILEDTPESHQKKAGTPTMGGLIFLVADLIFCLIVLFLSYIKFVTLDMNILPTFIYPLFMGVIGAVDDYLTVHPKNGVRGIKSLPKALIQAAVTVIFVCWMAFSQEKQFCIFGLELTGFWYVVAVSFIITGFVNFTNLTDGLDGLLGGIFCIVCLALGFMETVSVVMVGVVLAFLTTNSNPAKVFMGDTGSLFLGAYLMAFAFVRDLEWIIFIASAWIILEGVSVIIQWIWFKITKKIYGEGRRVFLMSPIHHHFEKKGYPEQKITVNAIIITIICSCVALLVYSTVM